MYIEMICLKVNIYAGTKRIRYRQSEVGKKVGIAGFEKLAKVERKNWFGSRAEH
jgi:hypothetical protein